MSARTPIEAWPVQVHRGRPGYSAGHFAMLAGAAEDPLRVAERIAARAEANAINKEALERCAKGEPFDAAMIWQDEQLRAASNARWERLQLSFDAVIAALESDRQTPVMKALVRQAKRARSIARAS